MLDKIKQFIDSENFVKYTLLGSLITSFIALSVAILFAIKINRNVSELYKVAVNHERVLTLIVQGKIPVFNSGNGDIPFTAYIYNEWNELRKRVDATEEALGLEKPTPAVAPNPFELPNPQ